MPKILLVEDDAAIIKHLTAYLAAEGFDVTSASGQAEAMALAAGEPFDLALMDISLAEGNGFSACRALKAEHDLPVIFLTASDDEYSTVAGFDVGADDYIPKPFRPRELVSRIRNVLRLTGRASAVLQVGELVVDPAKGSVTRGGAVVPLSALEYRLFLTLLNHRGRILSREQLLESIWDVAGDYVNDNTLTVYIKRLREKIERDPQRPTIIKTVRGLGYKVES